MSRTGACVAIIASAMLLGVSGQESLARIDVRVAVAPIPFKASDGRTHLAYELVVTDIPRMGAQIDRVEAFAESDAKPLITYAGSDLDQRVMRPEADPKVRFGRVIASGTTALIHVWITLEEDQPVPRILRHSFQVSAEGGQPLVAADARVDVRSAPPIIVGSPFRAGTWLAHNGHLGNTGPLTGEARLWRGERPGFRSDTQSTSSGWTTRGEPLAGISASLQTTTGLALAVKYLRCSMALSTQHAMA